MTLELGVIGILALLIAGLLAWVVRLSRALGELKTEVELHRATSRRKTEAMDVLSQQPTEDEFLKQRRAKLDAEKKP